MLEARAYNNSIYLMVATPYALVGGLGLVFFGLVWKARRTNPLDDQPTDADPMEEPRP